MENENSDYKDCAWLKNGPPLEMSKRNIFLSKTARLSFFLLSTIIPIKRSKKILLCFMSKEYGGNPKEIMEYVINKHVNRYSCCWLANSKKECKSLRKSGIKAFYRYSFKGIKYFKSTDVWITDNARKDGIPLTIRKNKQKVIQTWHGIGPKGLDMDEIEAYSRYDLWCCASEYTKRRHIELFGAPENRLAVTGYARLDTLYRWSQKSKKELREALHLTADKKIVLFAPTFETGIWPPMWGFESFKKFLEFSKKNELTIVFRSHHYSSKSNTFVKETEKYKNVVWIDMKSEPDTTKVMAATDILITDWSSLYTEYLMLKRPIVFMDICKKEFTVERGAGKSLVDPSIRPGFKARTPEELASSLKDALKGNPYAEEQEKAFKLLHGGWDGNSSEKVLKVIERVIENEK